MKNVIRIIFFILVTMKLFVSSPAVGSDWLLFAPLDYKIMKTVRFDVYYPEGMEQLAVQTAAIAEKAYVKAASYFSHNLTRTLPILIYDTDAPFQEKLLTRTYYSFLNYCILIRAEEKNKTEAITKQMAHAFQYNILLADNSGNLMNRNNCGLINESFLLGMAEYMAMPNSSSATNAFFLSLEKKYGRKIFGELLREMRDASGKDMFINLKNKKNKMDDIVISYASHISEGKAVKNTSSDDMYNETIFDFKESVFASKSATLTVSEIRAGLTAIVNNVYASSILMNFSSELNTFDVMVRGGILRHGKSTSPNFEMDLAYNKDKVRFNAEFYAKAFPFVPDIPLPDTLYNSTFTAEGCDSMNDYGMSLGAEWMFTNFFSTKAGVKLNRYRGTLIDDSFVNTVFAEPFLNLFFNKNGNWGGVKSDFYISRASAIAGENASYYKAHATLSHYLTIAQKHNLILTAFYGRIFGNNKEYVSYYTGGIGSLRAFSLGEYRGHEVFMASPEFDFTIVDGLGTSGLLPRTVSALKVAVFADAALIKEEHNEMKSVFDGGFGLRFVFYPSVIFKLDFVSPLNQISLKECRVNVNFGMLL